MALLDLHRELARARDAIPFSNGFEFESWSNIWCEECVHVTDCPLLLVMLHEKTPGPWREIDAASTNRFHCAEFERVDE